MVLVTDPASAANDDPLHEGVSNDATPDEELRELQLAAEAARRLVSQCRAHVEQSSRKLGDRVNNSAPGTQCRTDFQRAANGEHLHAFDHSIKRLEAMTNALVSHLNGLQVLLSCDTFYALPAMAIARSIAEVSSSTVWTLRPGLSPDERAARNYAALFAMLEKGIESERTEEASRTRAIRDELVRRLASSRPKVRIIRRVKDGETLEEVAQVRVGRTGAKTQFRYSQRLRDEIPVIGGLYDQMSAATHGAHAAVSASFDTPASYARGIGHIALESTKAWSLAVHTWLGVTPAQFWNETDRQNLIDSIPAADRAEFEAELAAKRTTIGIETADAGT